MATYSINIDTDIETTRYSISGEDIIDIIERIADNDDGLVEPVDIRDSALSLWHNIAIKETKPFGSTSKYIGIEGIGESNDLQLKIHLGKRNIDSEEVISYDIIYGDSDVTLFNTRLDSDIEDTKVSIFSGNDVELFKDSPYIKASLNSGITSSNIDIDFKNTGHINLESKQDVVSINGITFSTIFENISNSLGGKILMGTSSGINFSYIEADFSGGISSTGSVNFGGDIYVNNYPLYFEDNRMAPIGVGDIIPGESFQQNTKIVDILKRLVYSYVAPDAILSIDEPHSGALIEFGSYPKISISVSINKKTNPIVSIILKNMSPGNWPPITTTGYSTTEFKANGIVIKPFMWSQTFSVILNDGQSIKTFSTTLLPVFPNFYGQLTGAFVNNTLNFSLNKLLNSENTNTITFDGSGYIYYAYPSSVGSISDIIDLSSGDSILDNFTYSQIVFSSYDGFWAGITYSLYRSYDIYSEYKIIRFVV